MTAQIHDKFLLNNRIYPIVGIKGGKLFDPKDIGLNPVAGCTACWRGYVAQYCIKNNRLTLNRLEVSLGYFDKNGFSPQRGPEINRIRPIAPCDDFAMFNNIYEGLNLEIRFTGGILIGDDFIRELYVHMGFQPAWKYRTVLELLFDEGKLVKIRDVSEEIRELRNKMLERPMEPGLDADVQEILSWIESTFELDYDLGE